MVVYLRDPTHGHLAIFNAPQSSTPASADVVWGPASIDVPHTSVLNTSAQVWLRLPHVPAARFSRWCQRKHIAFLGRSHHHLGFRVTHFSRYRYIDSDSDDDDDDGDDSAQTQPSAANRPSSARASRPPATPARRRQFRVPPPGADLSPQQDDTNQDDPQKKEDTQRAQRPRMSTRLLEDLDTDPDPEDSVLSQRDGPTPEPYQLADADMPPASSPVKAEDKIITAREAVGSRFTYDTDLPKLHRFRETLFAEVDGQSTGASIPGVDIDMADVPATPARRTSLEELAEHDFFKPGSPNEYDTDSPTAELSVAHEAADFDDDDEARTQSNPIPSLAPQSFPVLDESLAAGSQHVFTDLGLMLGRSFNNSFSFQGALVTPMYNSPCGFTVSIGEPNAGDIQPTAMVAGLRVHSAMWYAHKDPPSEADNRTGGVRMPTLHAAFNDGQQSDATLKHVIYELQIATDNGDENAKHAGIAFHLLLALYCIGDDEEEGTDEALLQRVATWGTNASRAGFDSPLKDKDPGLRHVVVELALGKVQNAIEAAAELGHLRLALLMSRAFETQKEQLREDAISQLATYGLRIDEKPTASQELEVRNFVGGDRILKLCEDDAQVSVEERMILLILAGHVAPVARFLNFSWYRLFTMELLYGAGSCNIPYQDRVSAAVHAVEGAGISTLAPHLCPADERVIDSPLDEDPDADRDVAYHILRLFANSENKRLLTSGIYSNSSFGMQHRPLDNRFSWLLHEVLSALIPEASPKEASAKLADALSAQLRTAGMRLWAFYVQCCSAPPAPVLRATLLRDWPIMEEEAVELDSSIKLSGATANGTLTGADGDMEMDAQQENDEDITDDPSATSFVTAKQFLMDFLNVPAAWICEAQATSARANGDRLLECELLLDSDEERLAATAHQTLYEDLIPTAVASRDATRLRRIAKMLDRLAARDPQVPEWTLGGGLVRDYLERVWCDGAVGVAAVARNDRNDNRSNDSGHLHNLAMNCVSAWPRARTDVQRAAMRVMADGIATAQRALLLRPANSNARDELAGMGCSDLEELPCTRGVKLRISGEYRAGMQLGWRTANRLAAALPAYEAALASEQAG